MRVWDSEDALNAILIANGDLDVVFDAKSGAVVKSWLLDENALDRIERRFAFFGLKAMEVIQDRTVKIVS